MGVRRLGSLAIAAVVVTACVAGSSPGWTAPASLAPPGTGAAAGSGAASPGPANAPDPSVTFAGAPLTLPAGWQAIHYDNPSSFFELNDYLGPEAVPDPCTRTANTMSCAYWPAITLPASGILVATWYMGGPPGNVPDVATGEAVTVAGRPARLAVVDVDQGCRSIGGDEQLRVIVPSEAIWNWEQMNACLRGPDHAAGEGAVRGLISGLPSASQVPMETAATYPNDNGYVSAPGKLRLRLVTFTFPEAWNAIREPYGPLDLIAIATLGPMPFPACNWTACGIWPAIHLDPNGIVLSVWIDGNGNQTFGERPGGTITVAGRPAKLAASPADAPCAAIGGDELLRAFVPSAPGADNLYVIDACLRGPDLATNEALFRQILASGVPSPHYTG